MSTKTAQEESAATSRISFLSSIAEDVVPCEKRGNEVRKDLANIVASLMKNKRFCGKVQRELTKYPRLRYVIYNRWCIPHCRQANIEAGSQALVVPTS